MSHPKTPVAVHQSNATSNGHSYKVTDLSPPYTPCSEWSDPQEDIEAVSGTPDDYPLRIPPSVVARRPPGIDIPVFLQPLLGMDFVPYVDERKMEETSLSEQSNSSTKRKNRKVNHDLECDGEDFVLETPKASSSQRRPLDLIEPDQVPTAATPPPAANASMQQSQPNLKKKKDSAMPGSAWRSAWKNRRRPRASRTHKEDQQQNGNHNVDLAWVRQQQASLVEKQEQLVQVHEQSKVVQQQAAKVETRIGELRKDVLQLQTALERSLQALEQETCSLESTQNELNQLQEQAHIISKELEESIAAFQQRMEGSQLINGSGDKNGGPPVTARLLKPPRSGLRRRAATEDSGRWRRGRGRKNKDRNNEAAASSPPISVSIQNNDMSALSSSSHHGDDGHNVVSPPPIAMSENRPRASTDGNPRMLPQKSSSASFMRVSDLEGVEVASAASSLSSSIHSFQQLQPSSSAPDSLLMYNANDSKPCKSNSGQAPPLSRSNSGEDFFFIDENVVLVMDKLTQLGYDVATDESDRFTPTCDTERLLQKANGYKEQPIPDWPIHPWHQVSSENDILVWVGGVPHKGFGHDWPVVKARGIVHTTPRTLLDFLLDSSQIKKYNKISQGRQDIHVIQPNVDTPAQESEYGFAGAAKIMRTLNKPKLLPKTIEVISLWNARPLENAPGAYIIVSRSVWEDGTGTTPESNSKSLLRSEMLLGVQLLRPYSNSSGINSTSCCGCELTTITHVYAPGVPETMAKRMAPNQAANMIRDLQAHFKRN